MLEETNIYISIITGTIIAATPIYLAALGELFSERSGVINIGLEGVMLMGAVIGVMIDINTNNIILAIFSALIVGSFFGLLHGILSVYLNINQIALGLIFFTLLRGLSGFIGSIYVGQKISGISNFSIPFLSKIPLIGDLFFNHNPFVYLIYLLVPISWLILYRTKLGISLRACGQDPIKAFNSGTNVKIIRLYSAVLSGMFAGIGGACLSLAIVQSWTNDMIAGRGWIAIGMVIFSRWNPLYLVVGAIVFGAMSSINFNLQIRGANISFYLLSMLPYLVTILVLIYTNWKFSHNQIGIPTALGKPFKIE